MARRKRRKPADETKFDATNMTPMIDVVFQLLIFFMLSMHFKEVEGKLLSQLPKDKGTHEKQEKPNEECTIMVEQVEIGKVYRTDKQAGKAAANRAMYIELGKRTAELYQATPSSKGGRDDATKRPPVILDADSETPYEHIIGAVNACKNVGIDNVEFVGNPRHDKYYGSFQKGQFEKNKK